MARNLAWPTPGLEDMVLIQLRVIPRYWTPATNSVWMLYRSDSAQYAYHTMEVALLPILLSPTYPV